MRKCFFLTPFFSKALKQHRFNSQTYKNISMHNSPFVSRKGIMENANKLLQSPEFCRVQEKTDMAKRETE